jgi:hypothetical protein
MASLSYSYWLSRNAAVRERREAKRFLAELRREVIYELDETYGGRWAPDSAVERDYSTFLSAMAARMGYSSDDQRRDPGLLPWLNTWLLFTREILIRDGLLDRF